MKSQPNIFNQTRRNFLKNSALLTLGSAIFGHSFAAIINQKVDIALVASPEDSVAMSIPSKWALVELKVALEARGTTVRIVSHISDVAENEYCVLACGINSQIAQKIICQNKISAPTEAESLCLVQGKAEDREILLAAGTDKLGLVYALTELADRVKYLSTNRSALEFYEPVIEQPASRTRSIMRHFTSEVEDKAWFYDHDYWRSYLTMLVTSRINRMSFTMGMGYDNVNRVSDGYLVFPYPFFVTVPGFDVRAKGLSNEERERNLAMLKFIGDETILRGLHFQIGIWTMTHKWVNSPNPTYQIEGLNDDNHTTYCREALSVLLHEVPTISGITFRVHPESGIQKGQENFWKSLFSSVKQCGRRVEIDLHAKNMEPEILDFALATGQPVVISPKYCAEHRSLPYHQASIREVEMVSPDEFEDTGVGVLIGNRRFTRYGYADTLAENRSWDVVFRIWPGTQRFLLFGDPETFAGYGRNASFCGARGIELSEPLGFKGRQGSGMAGDRNAYADTSLSTRYDFEKHLYTYRLWGRLGYNPDTNPEVWRRTLYHSFGPAASSVENALALVSRTLPLITIAHGPSGTCMSYWPEIYTNIPMADTKNPQPYVDTQSPKLFGNVSSFDPQLFQSPNECGDALVKGHATGKYSPLEVAQWLEDIAIKALMHIKGARVKLGSNVCLPEFRRVEEDVLIQRGIALFFAGKFRSAVLWRIYTITENRDAGNKAIAYYVDGRNAWAEMAERASGVYHSDITYGERDTISGHWIDRIPSFDQDILDLRERLEKSMTPETKVDPIAAELAFKRAIAKPVRPFIAPLHTAPSFFRSGQPLTICIRFTSAIPHRVVLHYRCVNHAVSWQSIDLLCSGSNFNGEIPSTYTEKRYALQYYFEIETDQSEATLFPLLNPDLSNVPYYIVRRNTL